MKFSPFWFFTNLMAYAVLMGVAPWIVFTICQITSRPPVLVFATEE